KNGVRPDEDKIEKVKNLPKPTNLHQLRGFIGLASYYRRFIRGFTTIAQPLHKLLEKNVPYEWAKEQQYAFETLKRHLMMAPILRYPEFKERFYLHTDALSTGLGAILAQKDKDNKEYVIAYASRELTRTEQNYLASELECLAVLWAVERFHYYLEEGTVDIKLGVGVIINTARKKLYTLTVSRVQIAGCWCDNKHRARR
ncbi:11018_t:CDS:2, partial [Cetraspora pellucida]